ncbi:MAG TPA: BlaI/MecI/CopY family transcriptional regulator [Brevibacterium senegalense]|uniref:BlaI/MecI/CopY family transcriptional regulator n=1 Tax=Brevibacterium senegalense TaxID=1033736 RepID=A0A921SP66_9MICO|nr:BlaI/MecI/CopY family transcriptional regulator [Brevibacterium senegalense]
MAEQPRPLGPLERQVLETLWAHGPLPVRGIILHLPAEYAYTTIATVLGNLKRKGCVDTVRRDRSTVYRPTSTPAEHDAAHMRGILAASADRSATILRFADSISPDDLALLRAHLGAAGADGDPTDTGPEAGS